MPAARLSIAYSYDAIRRLCSLVGPSYAKDILITARRIQADEALRIGLVNRVVTAADLDMAVAEYTDAIEENAPLSMHASKLTVTEILKDSKDRDMAAIDEIDAFASIATTLRKAGPLLWINGSRSLRAPDRGVAIYYGD